MKTNRRFLLAAIFGFALAFTFSCSSSGDDPNGGGSSGDSGGGSSSPSGGGGDQVYNIDGSLFTGSGAFYINSTNLKAGDITNGKVNLQLPAVPDVLLEDFDPPKMEKTDCTISPSDIKGLFSSSGLTININDKKRFLGLGVENNGSINPVILYWYFSTAAKITCSSRETLDGDIYIYNINIDAKPGWNNIYHVRLGNSSTKSYDYSTDNIITQEVKWLLK